MNGGCRSRGVENGPRRGREQTESGGKISDSSSGRGEVGVVNYGTSTLRASEKGGKSVCLFVCAGDRPARRGPMSDG